MTQIYSYTTVPQVSDAYYHALLDFLRHYLSDDLLQQQGVSLGVISKGPLPVAEYLLLVDIANQQLDDDWGIDLGLRFRPATYGILGLLPLHCENLLEALSMVLKFESLVHDLGTSHVTNLGSGQGSKVQFSWQSHINNPVQRKAVMQSVLAGMQQFSSWLTGSAILFESLILPTPCHHEWLNTMGVTPVIKAGTLEFQVSQQALMKPIPQADKDLKNALLNSAQLMMDKKQPVFIKKMLAWLDKCLIDHECTLEQAAVLLGISARTLQRHLQAYGISYQQLLVNFRKNKALALLNHSHKNIMQVAAELGFKEQSSFSNAFKSWFGQSPMSYLKNNNTHHNGR